MNAIKPVSKTRVRETPAVAHTAVQSAIKPRARMRDVAAIAGVGSMTVSRVLSGSVPVSDEVRARVMAAVQQLDYRPNEIARSLRESRSRSIGMIVPNFLDSFFACCAHEINQVAQEHDYSVMVTTSNDCAQAESDAASLMVRRNVDGIIVIPAWNGPTGMTRHEFQSIPVVALDRPINANGSSSDHLSSVLVDNRKGARLGVDHLIEHGHQRILYVGLTNDLYTLSERHAGYVQAMRRAGLKPEACFACKTQQSTLEALRSLRDQNKLPPAIFTSNNLVTLYTLHALAELKLAVPKKVAVLAFDDLDMFDLFLPPVTVVRQPIRELGRTAAELLFARLKNPETQSSATNRKVVLPVDLLIRRSCGCHP